uniref:Macaca fascicularis brain cDNA, clone: QflA-21769 n=1 Tax=Macaca fascicularis TaxID=9541 RepID=I7GNP3_MACFA|nr:unnamed protein product [Macaca fascicularis]
MPSCSVQVCPVRALTLVPCMFTFWVGLRLSAGKLTFAGLNRVSSYAFCPFPAPGRGVSRNPKHTGTERSGRRPGSESEDSGPPTIDGSVSLEQGCFTTRCLSRLPFQHSEEHPDPWAEAVHSWL